MKEKLVQLICSNLKENLEQLREDFASSIDDVGVRYFALDNLLPDSVAQQIFNAFPDAESMRLMSSFRERKYTSKKFDEFDRLMGDITFAIQDFRVVAIIEEITGIKNQTPDEHLYAGGLSAMGKTHFLGPHIDNSHDGDRRNYRVVNLLYYVTPNWGLESGGNLELWDGDVRKKTTIVSAFNRLVVMETNPRSWHSVSEVKVDKLRRCISNYYFSPRSPTGVEYFNVTSFSARPEQRMLRLLAWVDNKFRAGVRFIAPNGLGKKDVYQGKNK